MQDNKNCFSVVVITYNEENNIRRCLNSLKDITDDIIVVDSGSSDNTVKICRQFGAKVAQHSFKNFSDQKNYANSLAKYDWILSIDADEEADKSLHEWFYSVDLSNTDAVYSFDRKTNYCGRWMHFGGLRHNYIERLFNKKRYEWKGDVHEKLSPKPALSKRASGRLNHYTFRNYDDHLKTMLLYANMQSNEFLAANKKIRWSHLFVNPCFKFIKNYIVRLGFLDGFGGLVFARFSAFSTFLKYSRAKWNSDHNNNITD